ncbi:sensor histidine kinase [Flexivirga meconopsidis]|uniref:sensor histidine kinase n=1 Tax=Flexivirga meconopsidis TaxID=2977121 RepID=UPI002240BAE5|nr:HAMP domain-containing sensor histidine kinase [Flexivirga meconopsidis]
MKQAAPRPPGLSVRMKLTLSYAGFLMVAGLLLLAVVWVFLLRYVPDQAGNTTGPGVPGGGGRPGPSTFSPGRSDLWRAFAPKAGWAAVFLLVFGLVGGWFLAGRMLSPLRRITDTARMASSGDLSGRIRLPGRRDEMRELADAFDGMLDRVEADVAAQQRFAANASHELRTPLAINQSLLEVAAGDPETDIPKLLHRLRSTNNRAIDLTEALLLLSRADRRAFTPERVDLSLVAEDAVETLLPLAEQHGVAVAPSYGTAAVLGSPTLLGQLATNLLHNAIVHNLDDRGWVRVVTSSGPGGALLTVENTGGLLAPQLVATLTEPFRRGTDRTGADHAGVGLGLAIARSIVDAHDGTLTLEPRLSGGLRVSVQLPTAYDGSPGPDSTPARGR